MILDEISATIRCNLDNRYQFHGLTNFAGSEADPEIASSLASKRQNSLEPVYNMFSLNFLRLPGLSIEPGILVYRSSFRFLDPFAAMLSMRLMAVELAQTLHVDHIFPPRGLQRIF